MADIMNPQSQEQPFQDTQRGYADSEATDARDEEQIRKDNELAERLSIIIEDANKRVLPIVGMLRNVHRFSFPTRYERPLTFYLEHRELLQPEGGRAQ